MTTTTINDIAKYTGISISTISRALRNPEIVSEEKRAIIAKAVEKLGYIPNYYASNLKSHQHYNVGMIINDVQNPFFNKLIQSIEQNLANEKYKLLISFGISEENFIDDKIKSLLASSVAGIMFSPNTNSEGTKKLLKSQNVYALQLFTKMYDNFDALVVDDFYGTYLAVNRLFHSGHKDILIIGFDDLTFTERLLGYRQAYRDSNLPINENMILKLYGKEFLTDRIGTKILSTHPTAIITVTDIIGVNTIKSLRSLSLSIPNDISIIHYDDSSWADLLGITTIGHPISVLGKHIATAVVNGIEHKEKTSTPIYEKIDPIILERTSIKNITNK